MLSLRYALITAARNEQGYIERTIEAIASQSVTPVMWAIVSDRSTDCTDTIIDRFARVHAFIHPIFLKGDEGRDFSRKVHAVTVGYDSVKQVSFDLIGNLDADIMLEPAFFENLLRKFSEEPTLGIAGGIIVEANGISFRSSFEELNRVDGACQLFRRQCYEQIGGYLPLRFGGEDTIAGVMARMHGWVVRSYPELEVHHLRAAPLSGRAMVENRMRWGSMFYEIGYHPLFEALRCVLRISNKPRFIGSLLEWLGYLRSAILGSRIQVPKVVASRIREEQMRRLRNLFKRNKKGGR